MTRQYIDGSIRREDMSTRALSELFAENHMGDVTRTHGSQIRLITAKDADTRSSEYLHAVTKLCTLTVSRMFLGNERTRESAGFVYRVLTGVF